MIYIYVLVFLLHHESFNVVLSNTFHYVMGVLHLVSEPCQG
jgi:hypothetical protein